MEIGSDVTCSVDEMQLLLASPTTALNRTQPYQFDHVFPGVVQDDVPLVILYAEIGSKNFASFHDILADLATQQKVKYILRHYVLVGWYREKFTHLLCDWCALY